MQITAFSSKPERVREIGSSLGPGLEQTMEEYQ